MTIILPVRTVDILYGPTISRRDPVCGSDVSTGPEARVRVGLDRQDSILGTSVLFVYPALITLIAILSAAAGVWLTSFATLSRRLVPFGGGVLLGVALFWVLPE